MRSSPLSAALRRHASLIVLGALVAGAGAIVYVDRGSMTTSEASARQRNLCPFFRRDEVTEVRLRRGAAGDEVRAFRGPENDAGQRPWQVELPGQIREPADEAAVDQLLASLRDGVVIRRVASIGPEERRSFGFDAPSEEITVTMGARTVRLALGATNPASDGAVYVEVDGKEAALITKQLAAAISVAPDALREKALVTWDATNLDALRIDGKGSRARLVRAPWSVPRGAAMRLEGSTPEGGARVAGAALDGIWEALGHLKADAFLSSSEAASVAPPELRVTLTPHGAPLVEIALGGECPGHHDDVTASRRQEGSAPKVACVPRAALEGLTVTPAELVDRHAIGARIDEVIEVTLDEETNHVDIARAGGQWHERTPLDRTVDAEVGRAFLERLLAVGATRLDGAATEDDLRAKGLGHDTPPRATVRVVSALGEGREPRVETLRIGATSSEGDAGAPVVHVLRVEDGALLTVPVEAARPLFPDELALRARKALDVKTSDFHALRIAGPLGVERVVRNEAGLWTFAEPALAISPDAGFVSDVLEAIGGLTVDHWVGAVKPEYGLDTPRLRITAEVTGASARTLDIVLGAATGAASSFARIEGDPAVFVTTPALEGAASRWLVDRMSLLVDVERAAVVTLSAGSKRVEVLRAGVAAGGTSDVRDALRDLVSEGAVTVGPPLAAQGFDKPTLVVTVEQGKGRYEIRFGGRDTFRGAPVVLARRDGVAATFAVAESRIHPLLDALR